MGPLPNQPPTFEELYVVAREHLPKRLHYLQVPPEDVDDIVHDVFLIARGKLDTYAPADAADPGRSLRAWLFAIAWRYVRRQRGKAHRRREIPMGDAAVFAQAAPSSEQLAAEAQRRRVLDRVLGKLRPERAQVLVMHTVFEMPVETIAGELDLNENTLKSRLRRAREDAAAVVRRLSAEERSVLQGCPLLLPLLLETSWLDASEDRRPTHRRGLRVAPAVVLGGVIAAGMAMGARLGCPAPRVEVPVIAAASDCAPAAAPVPVVVASASSAPASPASPREPASPGDTTARELALLKAARRALEEGTPSRAAASVRALDREIPRGALAGDRAWLAQEAAERRGTW